MKKFFLGLRQFILALIVLLGILIFPELGTRALLLVNKEMAYLLSMIGPYSVFSWLFLLVNALWYPIALTVWMARDAIKFKKRGIRAKPWLWVAGMISPMAFEVFWSYLIRQKIMPGAPWLWITNMIPLVVFSAYFIISEVVWRRRLAINNINSAEQEIKPEQRRRAREIFLGVVAIAFVVFIVYAMEIFPDLSRTKQKTEEQIAKIHATKLTLDDVMGKNLPPDPGADADKTIQGIDANRNGIRDDVELAIFKEYPDSAKTRAVLLQYALALQMEMTLPIINKETVTATVEDSESRANVCLWSLSSRSDMKKFIADMDKYDNFVKSRQINTEQRDKYMDDFYKNLGSYSSSNEGCDIDSSILSN